MKRMMIWKMQGLIAPILGVGLVVGLFSSVIAPVSAADSSQTAPSKAHTAPQPGQSIQYEHWEDLPPGPLKTALQTHGAALINNFELVGTSGGKPVLFRGGGFTPASLDWLINDMGVRTIVDLRGKFGDDKTHQVIAHSDQLLKTYEHAHTLDRLKNLSPEETRKYVENLARTRHIPVHYLSEKAESPGLMTTLNQASAQQPVAMFCQWGVNRSGTGWGAYAEQKGWSLDKTIQFFGVKNPNGSIRNTKDITYGYEIAQKRAHHS